MSGDTADDNPDGPVQHGWRSVISSRYTGGAEHGVHFYEDEEELCAVAADYLAAGLRGGERAVAVLTSPHAAEVLARLDASGVDSCAAQASTQLVVLSAEAMLARVMLGDMPERLLFRHYLSAFFAPAAAQQWPRRRAFGELVDLLWRRDNARAALEVERFWAELQAEHDFPLLCAYHCAPLDSRAHQLSQVCAVHTSVRSAGPSASQPAPSTDGVASHSHQVKLLLDEIAARKQLEAALRETLAERDRSQGLVREREAQLEAVIDSMPVLVAYVGADERYQLVNAEYERWFGCERSRLRGRHVRDVIGPEAYERVRPHVEAVLSGQRVTFEDRMHPRSGGERDVEARYVPDFAADGSVRGYVGLVVDITERRREEAQQRLEVEAQVAALVRAFEGNRLPAGHDPRVRAEILYELATSVMRSEDAEGVFEAGLDAIERALGTPRAAVLAYAADGVMRFRAWRGLSDAYRAAVEGHSPWPRDVVAPQPVVVADVNADEALAGYRPLFAREGIGALAFVPLVASGRLIGKFMVYFPGVRPLERHELEISTAIASHIATALDRFARIEALQQTVRFSEMFTGILGHDLRNPLGAILTAAHVVLGRAEADELTRPLNRIVNSGARMARMIDQLLDFTRIRVGAGLSLSPKPLDMVALLRQVMDELEHTYPGARLNLQHRGDPGGIWDEDRLLQVFSNLVANALQHGRPERGVELSVIGDAADELVVEVHNAGAIPSELLPALFEPMAGGSRRHDGSHGLGLGLYISEQIARAHRGRIDVQSSEAAGTKFRVILPRGCAS